MKPLLQRAARRLLLGLACATAPVAHAAAEPAKCAYKLLGTLPLRYSGPSLEITTEGSINGTPAEWLVDLGSYQTFLTRTGTERRGLKLRDTSELADGFGGASAIFAANVANFSVGPIRSGRAGNLRVLASFGSPPSYDGILGAPFLLQFDLEVSLATKQMSFFDPENCEQANLGYWAEGVRSVPLRRHNTGHKNPHFFVRINGKEMEAMIDTGATISTIRSRAARAAGIEFDTPGVERGQDIAGVGGYTVRNWIATVRTFQVGDETVENAEIAVQDSGMDGIDVILGADFLRSYRVLFAMSQNKLYFSHVDGVPFGQRHKLEPWIVAEAESGNADAQLMLAGAYLRGNLVSRDEVLAASWLDKAVASGSPRANLYKANDLLKSRDYARAAAVLRAALDKLPAERHGALALYVARVRSGEAELAKSELAATFSRSQHDEWPQPIAEFYLGRLSADKLLEKAADDPNMAKRRRCSALSAMGDWHRAHAQPGQVKALDEQFKASCADIAGDFIAIGD